MRFTVTHLGGNNADQRVKLHICETAEIARVVAKNLEERYGGISRIESDPDRDNNGFHLDYGGAVMSTWRPVEISLPTSVFSFYANQNDMVLRSLKKNLSSPRENGLYIKLHGAWSCLCLSVNSVRLILDGMAAQNISIDKAAESEIREFYGVIDDIRDQQRAGSPEANALVLPPENKKVFVGEA